MMSFFSRIYAVLAKELIQMRRDRVTFAMMVMVPIVQLLLFGYAINMDPKGLPTAIVDYSQSQYSRAITSALENSGYFRIDMAGQDQKAAERAMLSGSISFILTIPADLARRAQKGASPEIWLEADSSDPAASSGAVGALSSIASRALLRELGQEQKAAEEQKQRLQILIHRRFNPEGITAYNIVPGLLGVILQMTMSMMTAMALTREIERGTLENLLAMPASPMEIMLGKKKKNVSCMACIWVRAKVEMV